jgi:predicted nuclease of predicted toxin-antitoxin system
VKVLLDSCIAGWVRFDLEAAGHDVATVPELGDDPGDEAVLARAHREGRVLVTLDKDFGEMVVVRGRPHAGIVRLDGLSARQQSPVCLQALRRFEAELVEGAIVTADWRRFRVRPATEP